MATPALELQRAGEREDLTGAGPPPPAAPGIPAAPGPSSEVQTLEQAATSAQQKADTLADAFVVGMKAAQDKYDAAEAEMRAFQQRRQEQLAPERQMLSEALGRPLPPPPAAPAEQPPPDTGARPFLEGLPGESTSATLQRMLTGVSLLAQMGVGVGVGYSRGALAAYEGALEGWAKGDRQRAENDWAQYLQNVASMQRDYKNRRKAYDDVIEENKWNVQQLQLRLGMKAAELGEEQQGVELAFKSADAFQKRVQLTGSMLEKLNADASRATTQLLLQKQKEAQALELKRMGIESQERIAAATIEQRREATAQRAHELKIARMTAEDRRRDIPVQSEGGFFDKLTGAVMSKGTVTRGMMMDEPHRFTNWSGQAREQWDQANREMVMLNRLAELTPGLLAKYGAQNLMQSLQLRGEQKLALAPDLREFANLNEESNFALARVLSGGVPRVAMLKTLREHVGARLEDTVATALRSINAQRTTMRDFIEQKQYPGEKLTPHRHVSAREKNLYWQVWDDKTKQETIVKFTPGERIPDYIEPIENYETVEAARAAALARGLIAPPPKKAAP